MKNAKINWFDGMTGEGMVLVDGHSMYIHFTAIEGIEKNNYQWPTDKDQEFLKSINGRSCKISIYDNGHSQQVEKCILT